MSADGGCEAAVTARTKLGVVELNEWCELLYRRLPLKHKGAAHKSYVRPAISYLSETWCLKEGEMAILQMTKRSMVRTMCGAQLRNIKRVKDLMLILDLYDTVDQLAMANSVCWYSPVMKDSYVLRKALDFEVEGQGKGGQRGHGKRRLRKKHEGWFEQ